MIFVTNERTSSCCGSPVGRCNCGHGIDPTVQAVLELMRRDPATSSLFGTDRVQPPEPLPVFNWDFKNEFAKNDQQPTYRPPSQPSRYDEPQVTFVTNNGGNREALGLPEWNFEASPRTQPVANTRRTDDKPEPLPEFAWNWGK